MLQVQITGYIKTIISWHYANMRLVGLLRLCWFQQFIHISTHVMQRIKCMFLLLLSIGCFTALLMIVKQIRKKLILFAIS